MKLTNSYTAETKQLAPSQLFCNIYKGGRWAGCVSVAVRGNSTHVTMSSNEISGFLSVEALQQKIEDLQAIKECHDVMRHNLLGDGE